jgi:hypothetical protein
MAKYLMQCGHASSATHYGSPVCAICYGKDDGAEVIVHECVGNVGLIGRKAKCLYGDSIVDSRWDLALFEYRPDCEYDRYYCGCFGFN